MNALGSALGFPSHVTSLLHDINLLLTYNDICESYVNNTFKTCYSWKDLLRRLNEIPNSPAPHCPERWQAVPGATTGSSAGFRAGSWWRALESGGRTGWGFTLIELVISVALMSMILGAAYLCLKAGISTQKLVETREEILQSARVAMTLMTADLRAACSLSKDIEFVGMRRTLGAVEADNLDFATHNYTPRRAREGDWCEVSYFLDKDAESGQFNLWRRRDPTPDDEPLAGGSREEIARGVRGLKFEYYDGFEWFDQWGDTAGQAKAESSLKNRSNLTGLPEAVRITLSFDSNPRAKKEASAATESEEPPLVFQTVARLNLAAVASQSASSGSATNSPAASPAAPAGQPAPGGVIQ